MVAIANELEVTVPDLTGEKENPASVNTGGAIDTVKMSAGLDNLFTKKPTAQGDGRRERLSKLSYEDLLLLQEDVIAELRERGQK